VRCSVRFGVPLCALLVRAVRSLHAAHCSSRRTLSARSGKWAHCALHSVHCALCTLHCALCTVCALPTASGNCARRLSLATALGRPLAALGMNTRPALVRALHWLQLATNQRPKGGPKQPKGGPKASQKQPKEGPNCFRPAEWRRVATLPQLQCNCATLFLAGTQ